MGSSYTCGVFINFRFLVFACIPAVVLAVCLKCVRAARAARFFTSSTTVTMSYFDVGALVQVYHSTVSTPFRVEFGGPLLTDLLRSPRRPFVLRAPLCVYFFAQDGISPRGNILSRPHLLD